MGNLVNVDVSLADLGVEVHPGKRVDRHPGEEFQGAMIHPTLHWLGTSYTRRVAAMAATFSVLGQGRPLVKVVRRAVDRQVELHPSLLSNKPQHPRVHLRLADVPASPQSGQGHVVAVGVERAHDGGLPAPSVR